MNDSRDRFDDDLKFSQRHGYEPLPQPMQPEELSPDLRREIFNAFVRFLNSTASPYNGLVLGMDPFFRSVLGKILKEPEDEIDTRYSPLRDHFKLLIMGGPFNEVFDVIELLLAEKLFERYPFPTKMLMTFGSDVRSAFEKHGAAYWLDLSHRPYQIVPRSNKAQGEATRSAIETIRASGMEGADAHLRQAAKHIKASRFGPSIVDSMLAVESVARTIDPKAHTTLSPALDSLEKAGLLKHRALKKAFSKLYGYTNDEQGIRHAMLDKSSPDVDLDDAMFMFGACASFAAYLVNKHRKAEQGKGGGP